MTAFTDETTHAAPRAPGVALLGSPLRRAVAANVVLLAILVSMTLGPGAGAQPSGQPGPGRARGRAR